MKKLILMLACCLCAASVMASKPVNVGIHAGWVNSGLKTKLGESFKDANGYSAGLFARVNVSKFYIEPAVDYSFMKSSSLKMNYVQIPIMAGFRVLDLKIAQLRVFVGPEADFMAKKIKGASMKDAVVCGRAGAGIDLWKLTLDVDYKFGLSKTSDLLKKTQGVNVTVGFKIF